VANHQTRIKIGYNVNLFDRIYASNVVNAHLLTTDKPLDSPLPIKNVAASNIETIRLTAGKYTIRSSGSRSPGPALEITAEIDKSHFNFKEGVQPRASVRNKFEPSYVLQVAGQAFFITNGEPMYSWDFAQAVWHECPSWTINIPMGLAKILGTLSEFVSKLMWKECGFFQGQDILRDCTLVV